MVGYTSVINEWLPWCTCASPTLLLSCSYFILISCSDATVCRTTAWRIQVSMHAAPPFSFHINKPEVLQLTVFSQFGQNGLCKREKWNGCKCSQRLIFRSWLMMIWLSKCQPPEKVLYITSIERNQKKSLKSDISSFQTWKFSNLPCGFNTEEQGFVFDNTYYTFIQEEKLPSWNYFWSSIVRRTTACS